MKTDIQQVNETRKTVVISLSADEINAEEKKVLKEFSQHARIPGFRPGKAPEGMLRKKFSKEIANELNRRVSTSAYEELQGIEDLTILQVVDVSNDPFRAGEDGSMTFTVDVKPDFTLPTYKGLAITAEPNEVDEEQIDETIDTIRNQRAEYEVVERAAAEGDYVKVSYEGFLDGKPIAEIAPDSPMYGKQATTWEEAGNKYTPGVLGVVEGIIGMAVGDKKNVEHEFAADFEVEALQGKKGTYEVEVFEVREKILPEMDEEFFQSLQVENEEELRERLRDDFKSRKEQQIEQSKRSQLSEKLLDGADFPIPDSVVESERDQMLRGHMQRLMQQGITEEQMQEHQEEMLQSAEQAARSQVKLQLILGEIAKEEKIEVTNEDLQQRLLQEAMATRTAPDELVKEMQKDRSRLMQLQRDTLFAKTLDFVLKEATVEETKAPAETSS